MAGHLAQPAVHPAGLRIAERALINPTAMFTVLPFLTTLTWKLGHGWLALLIGPLCTLPLLAVAGALEAAVDTGLRLRVPPHRLRNLQAIFTISGSLVFYLALAPTMGNRRDLRFAWVAELPPIAAWTPPGAAVGAVIPGMQALGALAILVGAAALVVLAAYWWLQRALAQGIVAAGSRESARRTAPVATSGGSERVRGAFLSPLLARELRLLGRDRNFLVQTMVMPLLIVGFQLFLTMGGRTAGPSLAGMGFDHLAALGFGIASYTLMFSAFQTLNAEGKALWLLFTFPRRLEDVLAEKARLWGLLALAYPVGLFTAAAVARGGIYLDDVPVMVITLCGVPIYGVIAASLGVFGADPLAQETQRKIRPSYAYLYLLLASLYVYAIYATSWWQRLALMVITAMLAVALFQKARDRLPYLLDPSAAPPPAVSLADGMMAALLFLVLQGLTALISLRGQADPTGNQVLIAFAVAGAVTAIGTRLVQQLFRCAGIPHVFGPGRGAGPPCAGLLVGHRRPGPSGWLTCWCFHGYGKPGAFAGEDAAVHARPRALAGHPGGDRGPAVRGDHLPGSRLRRPAPLHGLFAGGGLLSALIFAVVHPPLGALPVFVLALGTAWAYERSGLLLAPMLAHATYNALVIGFHQL